MAREQKPRSIGELLKDEEQAREFFRDLTEQADRSGGTLTADDMRAAVGSALGLRGDDLLRRFGPSMKPLMGRGLVEKTPDGGYVPTGKSRQAAGDTTAREVREKVVEVGERLWRLLEEPREEAREGARVAELLKELAIDALAYRRHERSLQDAEARLRALDQERALLAEEIESLRAKVSDPKLREAAERYEQILPILPSSNED